MKRSEDAGASSGEWPPTETKEFSMSRPEKLLEQYREMAGDSPHETGAEDWSEALIGDAFAEE